jgi:hypothetical protein
VGVATALLAILLVGAVWLASPPPPAAAQADCAAELEPNDDPADAQPVADAACVEGELDSSDTDNFVWTVAATAAQERWTLDLEGAPDQLTAIGIFRLEFEADVAEPTSVDELATFQDRPGIDPLRVEDLLVPPGTYYLQVAGSGEETYRLNIAAGQRLPALGEREPNDEDDAGNPVEGAIALSGDLAGSDDWFAWTLSAADAQQRWQLAVQGPIGANLSIRLADADGGEASADRVAESDGRATLYDLGLDPGTYLVRVSPGRDEPTPYALEALPLGGRADDIEVEPNDDPATASSITQSESLTGRLAGAQDIDLYRFSVDAELAARRLDATLSSAAGVPRRLCLLDDTGDALQCREAEGSTELVGLTLVPGDYALSVGGSADPASEYALRVDPREAASPEFEVEPNDEHSRAAPLGGTYAVRGRLVGSEADIFRFTVAGAPQLWRIQALGEGITSLAYLNARGEEEQRRDITEDARLARLSNLYLLPGEHWIAVRGTDANYALRAIPIGPPDPRAEQEPNDDASGAHVLRIGELRTGLLLESDDLDVYRFFLAAEEHVAIRIEPPADGAVAFALDWDGTRLARRSRLPVGEPESYEALLQPGDYTVSVRADEVSAAEYRIGLERRDPFALPADLEPNDAPAEARPLPPTLVVKGTVGEDDADWYGLPELWRATTVTITGDGEISPALVAGEDSIELTSDGDRRVHRGDVPAGTPVLLRVDGEGAYTLTLEFADGPAPQPEPVPLPVVLSLDFGQQAIAAYWQQGQRLEGQLTLANEGPATHELTLDIASTHYAWRPSLAQTTVALAAGESTVVPVTVRVTPDAWADQPVQVTVRAADGDAQRTVAVDLVARRDADPVNSDQVWPLPEALLGGLNVAWSALGAEPVPTVDGPVDGSDEELAAEQAELHDGMTPLDVGFRWEASALPLVLTVDLAGDEPVPLAGVVLVPQAGSERGAVERMRGFDVLISTDGTSFQEAYSGEISPLPIEQGFVFDVPVPARFAQLRLRSTYQTDPDAIVLAEWKVIAEPGANALSTSGFNLANPAMGGHLVRARPQFGDEPANASTMLTEEAEQFAPAVEPGPSADWVIGFHDDRAAQITEVQWVDPPDSDPRRRFTAVELSISRESPSGPWEQIGTWTLERTGEAALSFTLREPTWARYVRFSASSPGTQADTREYPETIRVIERTVDDSYRSILGEWGHYSREGSFEALAPVGSSVAGTEADVDDSPAQAKPLALHEEVAGEVQIETDVDWYRIDVPAGQNTLRFTVAGEPTVGVDVTLQDDGGQTIHVRSEESSPQQVVLSATVEPGRSYLVRIAEPARSVVFAFDTSDSIYDYLPTVYSALARYALNVAPGREVANFLPFEEAFLLADWGDDPHALQAAVNDYPRADQSSAVEPTLVTATDALAQRAGTKAIVLITDGDSPGYPETEALWASLDVAQPRVFAVHLQLGEEGYQDRGRQQDTLQDWASVNGGYYGTFRTLGELDVAFDRAATRLRRPTRYQMTAVAAFEEPPGPGTISVVQQGGPDGTSDGGPRPASGIALEIVLDTSGSMLEKIGSRRRIDIAKSVLGQLITKTLPVGMPVALRIFERTSSSCDTRLEVPLGPLDRKAMATRVKRLRIEPSTRTPIGASLRAVAADLALVKGPKLVVLVTDGEETCMGNPAGAIESLVAQGLDVQVNIVGFAIDDRKLKARFRRWARIGNGLYFDATGAKGLQKSIEQAVQPSFRVLDGTGAVVSVGVVNGDSVAVPAGVYAVEVVTDPPYVFADVVVDAEENIVLTIEPDPESSPEAATDGSTFPPLFHGVAVRGTRIFDSHASLDQR